MTAVDRYSANSLKRLLGSLNSVTFRDENGEVEYFGQKVVMLRRDAFQLMKKELATRNAAGTANLILGIVGRRVGSEEGKVVMSQGEFQESLESRSISALIQKAVEETNMGYGKILVRELDLSSKTVTVSVRNSFEAENAGHQDGTCCFFLLGYLEGLFSEFLATQLRGAETYCVAKGDQSCVFELGPGFQNSSWKL